MKNIYQELQIIKYSYIRNGDVIILNKEYKIGYQGISGSYSETASKMFINNLGLLNIEIIPLVNSYNVFESLLNGKIDFGVMAISNSIGGIVKETNDVLKNTLYTEVSSLELPICHCVFKKKNIKIEQIKYIASHEQAIKQTRKNISKIFSDVKIKYIEDTALAAKLLHENKLDETTAVICSEQVGKKYNLDCIKKDIADGNSITTFILVKLNKRWLQKLNPRKLRWIYGIYIRIWLWW